MKFGLLSHTHPEYTPGRWEQIRDLYEGGFSILEKATKYLPKLVGESIERYIERCAQASYLPYLSMIAEAYVAGLFKRDLAVTPMGEDGEPAPDEKVEPFWADFGADADLRGNAFSVVMRQVVLDALLFRKAYISVDMPVLSAAPVTRAEEDAMGAARAYAFSTMPEEIVDWQHESHVTRRVRVGSVDVTWTIGHFRWCITRRSVADRESPDVARAGEVHVFTVWRMLDGVAVYERFRVEKDDGKWPSPETDIPPFESGTTNFRSVPILELELPHGLWLGNKLGPLALEHFRRRSSLNAAENRTLVPTPVVFLGAEVPGVSEPLPSAVQQNPGRGMNIQERMAAQGYLCLGADDKLEYPAPATDGMVLAKDRLAELVDEMFRVAHMMAASVSSTSTATGRSGASKAEDRNATNTILSALAFVVKDYAVRVYDFVAEARAEVVRWVATGCDSFVELDRAQLLEEAGVVGMLDIPSRTFRVEYTKRLATGLAGDLNPEQAAKIAEELEEGITEEDVVVRAPSLQGEVPQGDFPQGANDAPDQVTGPKTLQGGAAASPPDS